MAGEDDEEGGSTIPAPGAETLGAGASSLASSAPPLAPAVTGAAPAPTGPALDGLVVSPDQMENTRQQLLKIQQAKMANSEAASSEMSARIDKDRARLEQKYSAVGTDLPAAWDSNKKSDEHYTDPVTAFGSIGSVFAMLASSFAGLPMEAGLNAGAAAINAVHAGDEKAYNREYESWKANTDLAIKRHDIQRQAYNDALTLMNSNINAGRTKMELAATKFGDQKALALLENGMDKELTDLFVSRNKSATEMAKAKDEWEVQHTKVMDLRERLAANPDLAAKGEIVSTWTRDWSAGGTQKLRYDSEADYIAARKREKPAWTPDDLKTWISEAATAKEGEEKPGAPGPLSTGKMKSKAIQEIVDASAKEVEAGTRTAPKTIAEATAEYNRGVATPSGNRLDDIDKMIGMYDNGKSAIDRTLAMIDKHVGAVGAVGYATRLGERLGNIAGSNSTDRSQIAHDIEYLQSIAPRLVQDAGSRGLKAEADKINRMIAGLNMGDTTANTKRALDEIRELWDKMQQDNVARRRGTPNPATGAGPGGSNPEGIGTKPSEKPTSKPAPSWRDAPIVKPAVGPRADAGNMQMAGDVSDPNFWMEASA